MFLSVAGPLSSFPKQDPGGGALAAKISPIASRGLKFCPALDNELENAHGGRLRHGGARAIRSPGHIWAGSGIRSRRGSRHSPRVAFVRGKLCPPPENQETCEYLAPSASLSVIHLQLCELPCPSSICGNTAHQELRAPSGETLSA